MATDVAPSEIGQIALTVRDIEKAVDFYANKLGMTLMFEAPPKLAFFKNGSVRLMLSEPKSDGSWRPGAVVYYKVGDIEGPTATLKARGVKTTSEPHMIARMPDHELWMAFLEDPDGNVLALMEERR